MTNTSDLKRDIGKRIHDFRLQRKYTQAQFAECMDISVNFLSEIENGKKGMSQESLYKLCQYFGVSADYILFGTDNESALENNMPFANSYISLDIYTLSQAADSLSIDELSLLIDYLNSVKKIKEYKLQNQ